MRNVPINFAETIFEPFWDSGESYPGHKKYSVLSEYRLSYSPDSSARIIPVWAGIQIEIESQQEGVAAAVMERDCSLDITRYDIFRVFAAVPAAMHYRVICTIDGQEKIVIDADGNDTTGEYDGKISGKKISRIRVEFTKSGPKPSSAVLYWFGLSNSVYQAEMENQKSPYTPDWAGCFEENPVIAPRAGIFFNAEELEALRNKVKKEPFKTMFSKLREQAEDDLKINPEAEIGVYVANGDRRWARDRDMKRTPLCEPMKRLAFVGIVEGNLEMLRMACRMALSAAHHTYWCESIMGVFPGATWHHRSFTEEALCTACALVLDWAGSLLTWHGKNIIYDAIIMKGLPRLEADFKTIQYIREMNQGIVFSSGRITALLALTAEYPRYGSWLKDAEADLSEMIEKYVLPDGGTMEGPSYWNYTFSNILPIMYMLARYHGKTLAQYATGALVKTGDYALCMMSESADGTLFLPVNDSHSRRYDPIIPACYAQISSRSEWKKLYSRIMSDFNGVPSISFIIIAPEPEADAGGKIMPCGFTSLNDIGQTAYISEVNDLGRIKFHLCSGPTYFGHYHADKCSFIIEAAGEPIAIDRGVCDYGNPYVSLIGKPYSHNIFMPISDNGRAYVQPSNAEGSKVTFSEYKDGILCYTSDNLNAWEPGIYKRNYRRVFSPDPQLYIFHDDVDYISPIVSAFQLNTRGEIIEADGGWLIKGGRAWLKVVPVNWSPEKAAYGEDGYDENFNAVKQLKLYATRHSHHSLMTTVEILKPDKSILKPTDGGIVFKDMEIKLLAQQDSLSVSLGNKIYNASGGGWTFTSK